MKLFIQIPCYNEEKQLEKTLLDLPKKIKGISIIKILINDDGSIDNTFNIAKRCSFVLFSYFHELMLFDKMSLL